MTEGGSGETPLTPEEEAVTRLLAEAGGPEPMPASVAARLEGVLDELQAERAASPEAPVADVVGLRARRRWPRVLLAAAAVVVGGYAVGTVASQGTLSGSGGGATAASDSVGGSVDPEADQDTDKLRNDGIPKQEEESPQEAPAGAGSASEAAPEEAEDMGDRGSLLMAVIRLRSNRFEEGALRALRVLDSAADTSYQFPTEQGCSPPETSGGGRALPVRYDGTAAVLLAGPERGGTVEVTVYDCAGAELDSTLVRP